jgi:hypothetical protein
LATRFGDGAYHGRHGRLSDTWCTTRIATKGMGQLRLEPWMVTPKDRSPTLFRTSAGRRGCPHKLAIISSSVRFAIDSHRSLSFVSRTNKSCFLGLTRDTTLPILSGLLETHHTRASLDSPYSNSRMSLYPFVRCRPRRRENRPWWPIILFRPWFSELSRTIDRPASTLSSSSPPHRQASTEDR